MKIEVDINKKYFVLLVVFGLLIVGIVGVVAYGTDVPVNFGHSVGEINWDEAITKNITAAGGASNSFVAGGGGAGGAGEGWKIPG